MPGDKIAQKRLAVHVGTMQVSDPEAIPVAVAPDCLAGDRVLVRAWQLGDAPALFAAVSESRNHLLPWLSWASGHQTLADTIDFCTNAAGRWEARADFALGIWERSTGELLGGTGFHFIDWTVPAFHIGYWLTTNGGGRGYMTESVRLLIRFAFEHFAAQRLVITCDAENVKSRAIPERLGFVLEATLRNDARAPDGRLRDTLIYAMTPDDFLAGRWR